MSDTSEAPGPIEVGQIADPHRALGFTVDYLQGAGAFDRQSFGQLSRILIGQIARKHYAIAMRGRRPVGFVGYGRATVALIARMEAGGPRPNSDECTNGPCVMINAWAAEDISVSLAMKRWMRERSSDADAIYAERFYADGRFRIVHFSIGRTGDSAQRN